MTLIGHIFLILILSWDGFLSGEFYGYDYRRYKDIAYHSSEHELEVKGWVKIFMDGFTNEYGWYSDKLHLTSAQLHVLEEKGLEIEEIFYD